MNLCIIQARTGSTRLPGKVLLPAVNGMTILEYGIRRVQQATRVQKIVVATTDKPEDEKIAEACASIGIDCTRGSEDDVLDRYVQCARQFPEYENIIRITSDCPLIDPREIDRVVSRFEEAGVDFAGNGEAGCEMMPDGMDVEVFTRAALERSANEANLASEREHVTPYMRNHESFRRLLVKPDVDFSQFRLTLDRPEDYEVIKFVMEHSEMTDPYLAYISLLTKNLDVMAKNMKVVRNEGMKKSLAHDHLVAKTVHDES